MSLLSEHFVSMYEYYLERFSMADTGTCTTFRELALLKSSDNWNITLDNKI